MPRVKRGTLRTKKRRKVLEHTKGFKWRRKNVYRIAVDAMRHALAKNYIGRKNRKRDKRALWQTKINAAARINGMSYSVFMHALKEKNVELDRKVLADMAENNPETFAKIVEAVK
ncbi:MAG: 50S ribosomal protein L20 [Candidatus Spechtbacterales bacterium]